MGGVGEVGSSALRNRVCGCEVDLWECCEHGIKASDCIKAGKFIFISSMTTSFLVRALLHGVRRDAVTLRLGLVLPSDVFSLHSTFRGPQYVLYIFGCLVIIMLVCIGS